MKTKHLKLHIKKKEEGPEIGMLEHSSNLK